MRQLRSCMIVFPGRGLRPSSQSHSSFDSGTLARQGAFGPSSRSTTWRLWSLASRSPFTPKVGLCPRTPWWPNSPSPTVGWSRSWKLPGVRLSRCSTWPSRRMRASMHVHCMAGRHRAPLRAGALLGLLILELTLIQPWLPSSKSGTSSQRRLFRDRRNNQMIGWLRQACNRGRIVPPAVHLPVEFCRSDASNSVWHVRAPGAEGAPLQPSCKWRQASQHAKSAFAAHVIVLSDIEAALEQGRKWCHQCVSNLPAGAQGVLRNSLIEFGPRLSACPLAKCLGSHTFVFGPTAQLRAPLLGDPSVRGVAAQRKMDAAALCCHHAFGKHSVHAKCNCEASVNSFAD